jgi:hypothetical protein
VADQGSDPESELVTRLGGQPGLDLVLKMGDIANKVTNINYC